MTSCAFALTPGKIAKIAVGGNTPVLDDSVISESNGNIGVGTTVAGSLFSVGSSSSGGSITHNAFNIDSSGNITNLGGVAANINAATVDLSNQAASVKFGNNNGVAGSNVDIHTNNSTGYIKISPGNDGEVMRVNYDGNVGIGSTNPAYTLDVNGAIQVQGSSVHFTAATGGITAQDGIVFDPNGAGTLITITAGRNVGIGSASPGSQLDIVGAMRLIGTGAGGFRVQTGANTACTTTCTTGKALVGLDTGGPHLVGPTDATADECLCGS